MSLEMFSTSDIATAICRSCDKNEKLRLQVLLLVKSGLSSAKIADGLFSLKCKPGQGIKSFLNAGQLSELREALSKPIPTDNGYSRGWQTKEAIQFVRENFEISYSESGMKQIIKDLGFNKITCRPQSKKRNEALTNEFIAEIQKKITKS